jgi:hypothetical protein
MQIDFHHGVTYVVARCAGFSAHDADVIASSAQYVDDATQSGEILFKTGETYERLSSAHKMLDYRNFDELQNSRVWIPFHFLPGNCGNPKTQPTAAPLEERLVCQPDSFVARDMVAEAIREKHRPYALHRFGITMHVYADTWAHQGFLGRKSELNRVRRIEREDGTPDDAINSRLSHFFTGMYDEAQREFVSNVSPLGHGAVLSYPDKPYLNWRYTNSAGETTIRNNPQDFCEAVDAMYLAMRRFQSGDIDAEVDPLAITDIEIIRELFSTLRDEQGEARHAKWMQAVMQGRFSFGSERVSYEASGAHSWKARALGEVVPRNDASTKFEFSDAFVRSDWLQFHQALQAHRLYVLNELLPSYRIFAV